MLYTKFPWKQVSAVNGAVEFPAAVQAASTAYFNASAEYLNSSADGGYESSNATQLVTLMYMNRTPWTKPKKRSESEQFNHKKPYEEIMATRNEALEATLQKQTVWIILKSI